MNSEEDQETKTNIILSRRIISRTEMGKAFIAEAVQDWVLEDPDAFGNVFGTF